jgi:hypothetical protein
MLLEGRGYRATVEKPDPNLVSAVQMAVIRHDHVTSLCNYRGYHNMAYVITSIRRDPDSSKIVQNSNILERQ